MDKQKSMKHKIQNMDEQTHTSENKIQNMDGQIHTSET